MITFSSSELPRFAFKYRLNLHRKNYLNKICVLQNSLSKAHTTFCLYIQHLHLIAYATHMPKMCPLSIHQASICQHTIALTALKSIVDGVFYTDASFVSVANVQSIRSSRFKLFCDYQTLCLHTFLHQFLLLIGISRMVKNVLKPSYHLNWITKHDHNLHMPFFYHSSTALESFKHIHTCIGEAK